MWFELNGDERITERCASDDCAGQPMFRLEAGGVGSNYCSGCKATIDLYEQRPDTAPTQPPLQKPIR